MMQEQTDRNFDGDRKFYYFQDSETFQSYSSQINDMHTETDTTNFAKLFDLIKNNEIGKEQMSSGPSREKNFFGPE